MNPLFLLTREDKADDVLAQEASRMGFSVLRIPLLATERGAELPKLDRMLGALQGGTAIAWTSRRAARALVEAALPRHRETLARTPLFALGDESAAPAREAGLGPETPEGSPGGSRDAALLARFIAAHAAASGIRRVLFLHGDRSLADLPDGLARAGLEVEPVEVYRTRFLDADTGRIESALMEGAPVVAAFFSPSGVEALDRLLPEHPRARLRESASAIARGGTTLRALRARGFRNPVSPGSTPFDRCAVDVLRSARGGGR